MVLEETAHCLSLKRSRASKGLVDGNTQTLAHSKHFVRPQAVTVGSGRQGCQTKASTSDVGSDSQTIPRTQMIRGQNKRDVQDIMVIGDDYTSSMTNHISFS